MCFPLKCKSLSLPLTSLSFVLIIQFHVLLSIPSGLCSSGFLIKILHTFLISSMCAIYHKHFILHDVIVLLKNVNYGVFRVMFSISFFLVSPWAPLKYLSRGRCRQEEYLLTNLWLSYLRLLTCYRPSIFWLEEYYILCGFSTQATALPPEKEPPVPIGWTSESVWTIWRRENSWPYRDSNSDSSVVQLVASRYTDYAHGLDKWKPKF
jgi:hypothetical protein